VRRALAPLNAFLPLLLWSLRRGSAAVDGELLTWLRSAHLTEELRWQRYRAVCASALGALRDAGVPLIALKGAALGESVYPSPPLRHADDIDVLVPAPAVARAATRLRELGWREARPTVPPSAIHWPPLVHPSGLPLEIHHRLTVPYYPLDHEGLWARRRPATVAGVDVAVLSPADSLLHLCAHAMLGGRILRWVPDAWFLLGRHADLDWPGLVSTAVASRLALPVYVALGYLAGEMGAPVDPKPLAALRDAAVRTDFRGRCLARYPSRLVGRTVREVWARPGSRWQRLREIWCRAFPPPVEFALQYDLRWWQVPIRYAQRLARHAGQSLRDRRRRAAAPGTR
jgi:hypothetical protein